MAFRAANFQCYSCGCEAPQRNLKRVINGELAELRSERATARRLQMRALRPLNVDENTRVCINCNNAINEDVQQIENDPACLKLNVLLGTRRLCCAFCRAEGNLQRLSVACRVNIFVSENIFIPEGTRSCEGHLDELGCLMLDTFPPMEYVNRPYKFQGASLQSFLQGLRVNANSDARPKLDENFYSDDEFSVISPISKPQFLELFALCEGVELRQQSRLVKKKDLLMFLCKLRQGLSDNFLRVIFNYPTRQTVSTIIQTVRLSLMAEFVPQNIGFAAITRDEFIERHVTPFANELYNPIPDLPQAIVYVDGTYVYVYKSSNFRVLRQTYSMHKGRHLIKPALIVAPDGYILAIQGPYFADSRNNDAQMLQNEFNISPEMQDWFEADDIFIVDRGYRDAVPLLEGLELNARMPNLLQRGQRQFTVEEANASRVVTKTRWVVEARNGHLKSIFKFLGNTVHIPHLNQINEFYSIAGAIINKYHPPITMEGATVELAREILQKLNDTNTVQARVEAERLITRRAEWFRLSHQDVQDFPQLDLQALKDLTCGSFQLKLCPSYIQDKLLRDEQEEFQIDRSINEPGFLRVGIYSRFSQATRRQIFIAYVPSDEEEDQDDQDESILGYYCTCKSGARTIGTCSHVASVIWFLAFARYQERVRYPQTSLLHDILDAAHRPPPPQNAPAPAQRNE